MRKYLLAATAVAALAPPAFAAADGPYVGIEGGVTFPSSTDLDIILNTRHHDHRYNNGYQRQIQDRLRRRRDHRLQARPVPAGRRGGIQARQGQKPWGQHAADHRRRDRGGRNGDGGDFSVGNHIGIKYAHGERLDRRRFRRPLRRLCRRRRRPRLGDLRATATMPGRSRASPACATPSAPNVDAGLKYRYFHTGKLGFNDAFTLNAVPFTTSAKGNYDSHSLLASLVYNFNSRGEAAPIPAAAPAPPPPPPPEPPATQTCADGSVILATAACPAPPPPPPPPVERGERGR